MEETSGAEKVNLNKFSIPNDHVEDSGYASNLSGISDSFRHFSPVDCTPLSRQNSLNSFNTKRSGAFADFSFSPSKRFRCDSFSSSQELSPCALANAVSAGDHGSEAAASKLISKLETNSVKASTADSDWRTNSACKTSSKEVIGSSEPRFHFSTPYSGYSEYLDKLNASPSPLIKYSLIGREHIDFLYLLGVKEVHYPALQCIFSHLSDHDLYIASRVSKTWENIIMSNEVSSRRLMSFLCKPMKENVVPPAALAKSKETAELPGQLLKRVKLMEIQNRSANAQNTQNQSRSTPVSKSPPVSPSKVRFHLFQKEAQKLDPGEQLVQCPRCSLPSRQDRGNNVGSCTRQGCQYQFCLSCYCEYCPPHTCSFLTPRYSTKNSSIISSKASRRFLRRL